MVVAFSIKIAVDCENKMWLVYGYSNKIQCLTLHPASRKEKKKGRVNSCKTCFIVHPSRKGFYFLKCKFLLLDY